MTDATPLARPELVEQLRWTGATEIAAKVRAGELAPRDVVAAALARIDAAQPVLNAFTYRFPEQALADADDVARRVAAGEYLPLAGVPVVIKDDAHYAGHVVTHGSLAYTSPSTETAEIIQRVVAAGAVVVGSTRTPEFCAVPFTESVLGGITRNPWDPSRTPGGSSGGSAAAVAAGLVPIGLGGDGGGSLRGPGAWCGLVGLFPTPGSVSTKPDENVWTGLGVVGGLARTVADAAALYDVVMTESKQLTQAASSAPRPLRIALTYDRPADKPVPQGGPIEPAWRRAAESTAAVLRELGHTVEPVRLRYGATGQKFTLRYLWSSNDELTRVDAPERIERRSRFNARLGRLIPRRLMEWASDSEPERKLLEEQLRGYDLVLTPAMPVAPPPVGESAGELPLVTTLKAAQRVSFLNGWNHVGWPGVSVPAGFDAAGLPTSGLLTGRPDSEQLLVQVAAQLERMRPWPLGKAAP